MPHEAVKQNIMRMIREAPKGTDVEADIDLYLASEGLTADDLKEDKNTLGRAAFQTAGGAMGGTIAGLTSGPASPVAVPVGIGLGSSIAGQAYDLREEYYGRKNPEPLLERSIGAAEDVMLDVIAPGVLSKVGTGAKKLVGMPLEKARGMFKPQPYKAYQNYGLKPTAATVTQSKALGTAEQALGDYFFSVGPLKKNAQHNLEQLIRGNKLLAEAYGPVLSRGEIGLLLKGTPGIGGKKGTSTGVYKIIEQYDEAFDKMFRHLGKEIGNNIHGMDNTREALKVLSKDPDSGAAKFAMSILGKRTIDRTGQKPLLGLSFDALKRERSKIGNMLKEPHLRAKNNIANGELKLLYKAITQDMEQAAISAGKESEWKAINNYFKAKIETDIPLLEEIIKKSNPDDIYDLVIMKSTQRGGYRLNKLRNNFSKEEWDAVAGTVLGKMGQQRAKAEAGEDVLFSASTFINNWDRLSTSAKKALFGGTRYAGLSKELDEFSRVVRDFKGVADLANRSRTGSVLMFFSIMGAIGGSIGGVSGGLPGIWKGITTGFSLAAVPYASSRLLTNQKFVKWLSQGVKISKTRPDAMGVHLSRLMYLNFTPDVKDDVHEIIKQVLDNREE